MNIDYGNVQSNATVESRDDSPQIQDNPGHSTGLDPGASDWPIDARGLLQTGTGSRVQVLPRLTR